MPELAAARTRVGTLTGTSTSKYDAMGRLPQCAGRNVQPRNVSHAASNCALSTGGTSLSTTWPLIIYQQPHMDYLFRRRGLRRSLHLGWFDLAQEVMFCLLRR